MNPIVVQEQRNGYRERSQQIKKITESFFSEFLEGFFPEIWRKTKLNSLIQLPDGELFNEENTIVFQVVLDGSKTIIFVHINTYQYESRQINEEMFHIFSKLYFTYQMPVIPILLDEKNCSEPSYHVILANHKFISFNYLTVQVDKKKWREYLSQNNVVAAVLLHKMNFSEKEEVQFEIELLRMIRRIHINSTDRRLLYNYFTDRE
ncbi:MAG TPA: hypothetical protein VK085_05990 [Pseudogracilibacillus sp.]|nr:hypothetical protein [Pseudogracilibacillus sp.]